MVGSDIREHLWIHSFFGALRASGVQGVVYGTGEDTIVCLKREHSNTWTLLSRAVYAVEMCTCMDGCEGMAVICSIFVI